MNIESLLEKDRQKMDDLIDQKKGKLTKGKVLGSVDISSIRKFILDKDEGKMEEISVNHPDLVDYLKKLADPSVSREDFFSTIGKFNDANMKEKEGAYDTIHLKTDHGNVTVKYYENGSASISGSYDEESGAKEISDDFEKDYAPTEKSKEATKGKEIPISSEKELMLGHLLYEQNQLSKEYERVKQANIDVMKQRGIRFQWAEDNAKKELEAKEKEVETFLKDNMEVKAYYEKVRLGMEGKTNAENEKVSAESETQTAEKKAKSDELLKKMEEAQKELDEARKEYLEMGGKKKKCGTGSNNFSKNRKNKR